MVSEVSVALLATPDPLPDDGPMVSVLIPSYNYSQYIGEAIQSIMDQTYRNLEIVVIDNCSTDDSWEVIQEIAGDDKRFSLHRNETNVGILENFRRCFQVANGEFFMVLNADDRVMSAHAISRLVAALTSGPDVTLATSDRQLISEGGNYLRTDTAPFCSADIVIDGIAFGDLILSQMGNRVSEASTLFRKDLLPVDDDFYCIAGVECSYYIDIVWWLKLFALGRVAYIAEALGQFRVHAGQSSMSHVQDPSALPAWSPIIKGAKELGFLADRDVERSCLCALGQMMFVYLPGYAGAEESSLKELFRLMYDVAASVATLTLSAET